MTVTRFSQASLSVPTKYRTLMAGSQALGDYELISTTVLGSSAASVTFSGLGTSAAAYKHLQIRAVARSERPSSNADDLYLRMNSDTGSNYSYHALYGFTGTMYSSAGTSSDRLYLGTAPASTAGANQFSPFVMDLLDFSSTSKNKTIRTLNGVPSVPIINFYSGAWLSTSAITSLTLTTQGGNISTGSRFSLYGLK